MSYKSRITLSIGCLSNAHLKRKHGMFGQQSERAFQMYRMNVACRKSLYTQPGENRNIYDNGWIKKDSSSKQEALARSIQKLLLAPS